MALDRTGKLYVGYCASCANNGDYDSVTVYAPGSTKVVRAIEGSVFGPSALAFDDSGHLYVASGLSSSGSITVYARNSAKLLRTITQGIEEPIALAFGP